MPSAAIAATSPPSRRAILRTSIENLPGNCALRVLVLDAHHMGSADRCQAPRVPHPTLEAVDHVTGLLEYAEERFLRPARLVRSEFRPQINSARPRQGARAAFCLEGPSPTR